MTNTNRTKSWGFAAALLAGTVLGGTLLAPTFSPNADARPIVVSPPQGAPVSFAELIEQVSPAVVSVNVVSEREVQRAPSMEDFFEFFRNRPGFEDFQEDENEKDDEPETRESRSLGSGFFISGDGLIVTNNHVVAEATEIEVVLDDGRELEAELVGSDERTDLAVLRVIEPDDYPYVEFETSSNLRRGDWVVAVGNPFGFGGTATAGIISADGRQLSGGGPYTDFLQIDAPINRGNSGGPTFDLNGRVIGVNTAIVSPTGGSVGIGFAIPADLAKQITDKLIKDGKVVRGWLGVSIQNFTEEMADAIGLEGESGALVAQVVANSPAKRAGIKIDDIILEIDGQDMEDSTHVTRTVGNLIAGTSHEFKILRDGEIKIIDVRVDEYPDDVENLPTDDGSDEFEPEEDDSASAEVLGMSLRPFKDDERRVLGLGTTTPGLIITSVENNSLADDEGLVPGMAILKANFKTLNTAEDLEDVISAATLAGRDTILVTVRVDRQTTTITLAIDSEE